MQIVVLIAILLIALIYLHIRENSLIFQPAVKHSKILLIVSLILVGFLEMGPVFEEEAIQLISFIRAATWGLVIFAYYKFFEGCYSVAFLKRIDSPDPLLRKKIRLILQDVIKNEWATPEFKMFVASSYQDPLVEKIRYECRNLDFSTFVKDEREKMLMDLAEQLKE